MAEIKFSIAAKTDVGCVRTNNEDNLLASADLNAPSMAWVNNNQIYDLGDKGALLVVADGMGGMNAGEVASAIAIDTIREYFAPDRITPEVVKNRFSIEKYMKDVVVEADHRIKQSSTDETRGMGTTIVMAWLIGGQCYVCWCGDSRAYIYNPVGGLFQVSKDHSYVQSLVDAGEISEEDAFDYPNSNVITRCLCDAKQKAVPDCLLNPQPLCDGDIILLCSDGLSGMLRDNEMKAIIEANGGDMNGLTDALIDGALNAGGNDNVTVAVASIVSGGAESTPARVPAKVLPKPHKATKSIASSTVKPALMSAKAPNAAKTEDTQISVDTTPTEPTTANAAPGDENATKPVKPVKNGKSTKNGNGKLWAVIGALAVALLCAAAYIFIFDDDKDKKVDADDEPVEKVTTNDEEEEQSAEEFEEPGATTPAPTTRVVAPAAAPSQRTVTPAAAQAAAAERAAQEQAAQSGKADGGDPSGSSQAATPADPPAKPLKPRNPTTL